MTVNELTGRMWYLQQLVIIQKDKMRDQPFRLETIKERAFLCATPSALRSVRNREMLYRMVVCYGVIDNTVIIEVA